MEVESWSLCIIVLTLAAYRLTILITEDDGPFGLFRKLRSFLKREEKSNKALKESEVAKGIQCIRCSGYYISILLAIYAFNHSDLPIPFFLIGDCFLVASALSGAVILLNRAFPPKP